MLFRNLLLASLMICSLQTAYAQEQCSGLFAGNKTQRELLLETLRKPKPQGLIGTLFGAKDIKAPIMMKKVGQSELPVILANAKTYANLKPVLDESFGIIVQLQPNWRNDHGMLRIGENIIDMDSPGYRARGELHKTGIAWVDLKGYLDYSYGRESSVRVEVLFSLASQEHKTVRAYHMMRRSAIIRVPFAFGDAQNDMNQPNLLKGAGENCFSFCQSSYIDYQTREIQNTMSQLGFQNISEMTKAADIQGYLGKIEKLLTETNYADYNVLNPNLSRSIETPTSLSQNPTFINKTNAQKTEVLNWLIGYHFSSKYSQLLKSLDVRSGNGFESMQSSKATAVLIYDSLVKDQDFLSPNYTARGIFSTWTNVDSRPLEN